MHVMTYFNSTHAKLDGSCYFLIAFQLFEVPFQILSICCYVLLGYINAVTPQYHLNMRILYGFFSGSYPFYIIGRLIHLRYTIGFYPLYENDYVYIVSSYIRCFCFFIAFTHLPVAITERCCATYYVKDYEERKRLQISSFLLVIQSFGSLASTIAFQRNDNTLLLIGVTVAVNKLAVIVNLVNERINIDYFKRLSEQEYSLAKRYQISENIKTCKRYKILVLSVLGFNMICIGAVVIDNFDVTIFVKNMANTVLNYSVLMYGFTMPSVMLFYNELWQRELKRIVKKICSGRKYNNRAVNIKSTFGKDMINSTTETSQRYFEMLRKDWY